MSHRSNLFAQRIRLRYAIFVNFTARIASYLIGLFFTVIITRKLSIEEFATWVLIFKYITYVVPLVIIYNFWLPRTISRGYNTAKAGLFLSLTLGSIATIIYIIIAYNTVIAFNYPFQILLLASVLVIERYIYRYLCALSISSAPHYIGYSNVILRTSQTILVFIFIFIYKLGLFGALMAVILGRTLSILILSILNYSIIVSSTLDLSIIKIWFKRSWLPLMNSLTVSFVALDVVLVRILYNSEKPIAFYGVISALLNLAVPATSVYPALYSRLLAKREVKDLFEAFWISYVLCIPVVVSILTYAEPLIAIYGVKYLEASWAARIFVLSSLLSTFVELLKTSLWGLETGDIDMNSDFGFELINSMLFKVPFFNIVVSSIYLCLLALVCISTSDAITLIILWGILYLIRYLMLVIAYVSLLKEFKVSLNFKLFANVLIKCLLASTGILIIHMFVEVKPSVSIWQLLSDMMPVVLLSTISYFGLLYIIDEKFRKLLHTYLCKVNLLQFQSALIV